MGVEIGLWVIDSNVNLWALPLEKKSHQDKVDGDADGKHGDRCPTLVDTEPYRHIEHGYLQEIVDGMGEGEAGAMAHAGLDAEGETGGGGEVEREADGIGDGHGQRGRQPGQQEPIDTVLYGGGDDSHDAKAYNLAHRLAAAGI